MAIIAYLRSDLRTDARLMLRERTAERFQDTDFDRWADQACALVAAATRCLRTTAVDSTSASQAGYDMPADCIGSWGITRLEISGVTLDKAPMEKAKSFLRAHYSGLDPDTAGTPKIWCPYGQKFYLVPKPSATGTNDITLYYSELPEAMAADATAMPVPTIYAPAVEKLMVARGLWLSGRRGEGQALEDQAMKLMMMLSGKQMPDSSEEASASAG